MSNHWFASAIIVHKKATYADPGVFHRTLLSCNMHKGNVRHFVQDNSISITFHKKKLKLILVCHRMLLSCKRCKGMPGMLWRPDQPYCFRKTKTLLLLVSFTQAHAADVVTPGLNHGPPDILLITLLSNRMIIKESFGLQTPPFTYPKLT